MSLGWCWVNAILMGLIAFVIANFVLGWILVAICPDMMGGPIPTLQAGDHRQKAVLARNGLFGLSLVVGALEGYYEFRRSRRAVK
jgi:hypothetical protein